MEIYPSLISADILNLEKVITSLQDHCDGFHIDVMDDHFVPNLTWGPAFIKAFMNVTPLPLHIHLMVDNPEQWIERLSLRSDDVFIFHLEAVKSRAAVSELISSVKQKGWNVGIAINPKTPVDLVFEFLSTIDCVVVMSVEPGFSGQKFMPEVMSKVTTLVELKQGQNLSLSISMDGGIGEENIHMLAQHGVDNIGVASAIFAQKDYLQALKKLKALSCL